MEGKVGKYRIIYEVDWENKVVFFHDVGPRRTIYRRLKRKWRPSTEVDYPILKLDFPS